MIGSPLLAVHARGLTKSFGSFTALDHLDLSVPQGSVFGYLGPNGAGKTTRIRLLMGLLRPSSGRASILGLDVTSERDLVHAAVGYLEPPWRLGWRTNRLLIPAVGLAGVVSGLALGVGPIARSFDQALPSLTGWLIALATAPVVLLVDAASKHLSHRARKG